MKRAQTTFQIDLDRTKNVINIFFSIIAGSRLAVPACFVSPVIDVPLSSRLLCLSFLQRCSDPIH